MIGQTYVVGFMGLARSGKDTAVYEIGKIFKGLDYGDSKRFAFADPLKKIYEHLRRREFALVEPILKDLNGEQRSKAWELLLNIADTPVATTAFTEETKESHRPNLIALGIGMRQISPDFWRDAVVNNIEGSDPSLRYALISDVRFPNETQICDLLVRIVRPNVQIIYDSYGKVSESEELAIVGPYDALVDNSRDMFHLKVQLVTIAQHCYTMQMARLGRLA